jgi:chemotaxis protein histidine kinase CheA
MDLHGTVGVESEPGRGTRITIDIPVDDYTRT